MDSSDLLGSLMGQLGGGGIEEIGRSVGLDSGDVSKVLAGAMPAILSRFMSTHFPRQEALQKSTGTSSLPAPATAERNASGAAVSGSIWKPRSASACRE